MLKDYITNAAILVSFISIVHQIFRYSILTPTLAMKFRILLGGVFGLLGIALMIFGISLPNHVIVDFRHLAVFLSAITGGWVSTSISALIIAISRLLFFGINRASVVAIIVMLISGIIFYAITNLNIKTSLKWFFSILTSGLLSFVAFTIIIDDSKLRYEVILQYSIGLTLLSFLLYYYVGYMNTFTESLINYKKDANKDFLTGLNNVRQFDNLYNSIISNVNNTIISLLYIDIDFFKSVNDTYGHPDGDRVLKELAQILLKTCRSIDIVSRNGGEEFSVILVDCSPKSAMEIAERIRKNVEATTIELSNQIKINITISIGGASYPNPVTNPTMLIEKADIALYEAKRTGRNKTVFYTPSTTGNIPAKSKSHSL